MVFLHLMRRDAQFIEAGNKYMMLLLCTLRKKYLNKAKQMTLVTIMQV